MKKLSTEEEKHLGKQGVCKNCGSEDGRWEIDPYQEDIHQEQILVCVCEKCYDIYVDEI